MANRPRILPASDVPPLDFTAQPPALLDGGPMGLSRVIEAHEAAVLGDATLGEQLGAAFRDVSTVSGALRYFQRPTFTPDPSFDPAAHLTGEDREQPEDVIGRYLEAQSLEELEWLRQQQRRRTNIDRIAESGPLPGLMARMLAAVVDPINLLPLGWVAQPARIFGASLRAGRVATGAAEGALIGAAATAAAEPFMQAGDPFRTLGDGFVDIMLGGVLGAGLGAGLSAALRRGPRSDVELSLRDMAIEAEAKRIDAPPDVLRAAVRQADEALDTAERLVNGPVPRAAEEPLVARIDEPPRPAAPAGGAAVANEDDYLVRAIRPELTRVIGESVLRPIVNTLSRITGDIARYPGLQLALSRFSGVRAAIASIADVGVLTRASRELTEEQIEAAMKAAEDRGYIFGAAEERARVKARLLEMSREGLLTVTDYAPLFSRIQLLENESSLRIDDIVSSTRAKLREAGLDVSDRELDRMLAERAQFTANPQQFGGVSPAPVAARPILDAALAEGRALMDRLFSEAQRLGIIPEEIKSRDIAYWPLAFDREAILADHQGFRNALFRTLKEQQRRALDVVEPFEQATAAWFEQGRVNRESARAARQASDVDKANRELYLDWYAMRRTLGRYNGEYKRIAAAMRRAYGDQLAPGQTMDAWVAEQATALDAAGVNYRQAFADELKEYSKALAEELNAAAREGRRPRAGIVDVSPGEWAARRAEERGDYDMADAMRIAEYAQARENLDRAVQTYDMFRKANNDAWRAMTRPFISEADKSKFPLGYDIPAFRPARPLAPADYEKYRRLVRGVNEDGTTARLADDASIWREVDEMFNTLTVGEDPYRFAQLGMRGHLKQRGIEVNWSYMQPYTVRSFRAIMDRYMTMVGRDVEVMKTFGTWKPDEIINRLSREPRIMAERLTDAAEKELRLARASGDQSAIDAAERKLKAAREEAEEIMREFTRDAEVLKAMLAQARGTFSRPPRTSAEAKAQAAIQTGMTFMFLTRMGSVALAQIGDATTAVLKHGLVKFAGSYVKALAQSLVELVRGKDPGTLRLMRMLGTMSEGAILTHNRILHDVAPNPAQGPVGRALNRIAPVFSRLTLAPFMNDVMRRAGVNLVQDDFVRIVMGDARSADARRLWAQSGITPSEREILRDLIKKHAREDWAGNLDLHIEEWMSAYPELADKVRAAIHHGAQRVIITPTAADTPIWTQTTLGRPVTQFKRFVIATVPQLLIPTFQSPGLRKLEVALAAAMFGTLSVISRDYNTLGYIKDRSAAQWVIDSLNMSGLTSMIYEPGATLATINPYLSIENQLTGEVPGRYFERNLVGQILGPLAGTVFHDIPRALWFTTAALSDRLRYSPRDVAAFRSLIPGQNHIIARHPIDLLEAEIGGRERGPAVEMLK